MADPRFFRRAGPFSLGDLAGRAGTTLAPGADAGLMIADVAPLETAGSSELTYFADPRYVLDFAASTCGACITTPAFAPRAPKSAGVLIAADPRAAYAAVARIFYSDIGLEAPRAGTIAADARIETGVTLMPGAAVGAGAEIGAGSHIGANAVVGAGVVIGRESRIGANATLSHCLIGEKVVIHPGVQIGQDGFGFVPTAAGLLKIPQLGRVIVEDNVEIGANSTVDRGASGDTVIGAGTKIDNLVQIGHNVRIGRNCIIVAQVGISGSCTIGNNVVIGGQVGFADHVTVGDGAQIAAKSGLMRDVAPGEVVMGYPARPIRQFWREVAALTRLTKRG